MAEARSAVSEPRDVEHLEESENTWKDFARLYWRSIRRRVFRTRNQIYNGLWPTPVWNLVVAIVFLSVLLVGDWQLWQPVTKTLWAIGQAFHIHSGIPFVLRVLLVSAASGLVFFTVLLYVRRWLLRALLSYRGWMYEAPKTRTWSTMFWAVVVRLVSGYHPTLYSYQQSLPRLPVPPLKKTLKELINSLKPLYGEDSEELKKLKQQSKEFAKKLGPRLQRFLVLRSWWQPNWVTDWWNKYIYLMGRSSISINSNYYVLDQSHWLPSHRQVSRAASVTYQLLKLKRLIDRQELHPLVLRGTVPLCMAQYENMFSTTRIPGEELDELVHYSSSESKHIVVLRKGLFYKLDVMDKSGNPLMPQSFEKQVQWIIDDADKNSGSGESDEGGLPALTGMERPEWAKTRQLHFNRGINKESLDTVEKAIFVVVLETRAFDTLRERGKHLLHADGKSLWFDKSFNIVFFNDGRYGLNCEHTWGDAPVVAHMSEYNMTAEGLEETFDDDGYCKHVTGVTQGTMIQPSQLHWDIPTDLKTVIHRAVKLNVLNNDDLDLCIREHVAFGKGFIKKCKVSPDSFIQCALQLAYYKDAGCCALTYESSMTRLYLQGRTETVRSLTSESAAFVKAMVEDNRTAQEKIRLLQKACNRHQFLYRNAMSGMGIDRHLFGLYVTCKGLGYENEFLHKVMFLPWTLSTSQQPQQQIANTVSVEDLLHKTCPGGGFGPVSDAGYGVSYMIIGETKIFFHVSSKHSSPNTNSEKFADIIFDSFREMKALFD